MLDSLIRSDSDLLESFELKLQIIRDRVRGVAEGYHTAAYLTGRPGTSKTYTVREELKQIKAPSVLRNARMTPMGLFEFLCEHPEHVIVLDEASDEGVRGSSAVGRRAIPHALAGTRPNKLEEAFWFRASHEEGRDRPAEEARRGGDGDFSKRCDQTDHLYRIEKVFFLYPATRVAPRWMSRPWKPGILEVMSRIPEFRCICSLEHNEMENTRPGILG
jgi:hypothetical protein